MLSVQVFSPQKCTAAPDPGQTPRDRTPDLLTFELGILPQWLLIWVVPSYPSEAEMVCKIWSPSETVTRVLCVLLGG